MTTRKTASKRAAKNPVSKKKSSSVSTRQQAAKKSAAKKSAAAPSASKARKTSRLGRGLDILLGADALAIDTLGELSARSEEHTSELQSRGQLVCRLLLEQKNVETHEVRTCREVASTYS